MSNKEMTVADKAYEVSIEIYGVSMVLAGLSNQLDREKCDTLTESALEDAIYAIRKHLERIANDLEHAADKEYEKRQSITA